MNKLTDDIFKKNVLGKQLALVEFTQDESGLCYIVGKIIRKIERDYGKEIGFFQIDFSENKKSVNEFRISRVPTILFFKNGDLIDRLVGTISENEIISRIDSNMKIQSIHCDE